MTAYYNEHDAYAAQWLRNLIEAGEIAPGVVDERSIEDVKPSDLAGFTQCHFFAGIGVWSYALRRAGWPDARPVWTGSCPCQPFSAAGQGAGFADERHLWPDFNYLVEQCRPAVVFGEQVASKDAATWIDLVQTDLEAMGYAFGAVPFPSASVGAPHIRDRLYWVADAGHHHDAGQGQAACFGQPQTQRSADQLGGCGSALGGLGYPNSDRVRGQPGASDCTQSGVGDRPHEHDVGPASHLSLLGNPGSPGLPACERGVLGGARWREEGGAVEQPSVPFGGVADTKGNRHEWAGEQRQPAGRDGFAHSGAVGRLADADSHGRAAGRAIRLHGAEHYVEHGGGASAQRPGPVNGFWAAADWLLCRDGKWRPVEPGASPLVDGPARGVGRVRTDQERIASLPRKDQGSRIGRLKGYGNAINAEAAIAFIKAYMEPRL